MGLVILHCAVHGTWSPLMLVSDKLSVTFSGLAEDMYKPDVQKNTGLCTAALGNAKKACDG